MGKKKAEQQWDQSGSEEEEEYEQMDKDGEGIDELNSQSENENQELETRFAQYLDSDEDFDTEEEHEIAELDKKRVNHTETENEELSLRKKIERIPFSALAKAKRTIRQGTDISNEDDHSGSEIDEFEADRKAEREKQEKRSMRMIEKRESKHA